MLDFLCSALRRAAFAIACLAVASCADTGPPKPSVRDITSISVDPDVVMPDSIYFLSAGQVWGGAVGGVIGGSIAAAGTPTASIKAQLQKNQISMDAILVEELRNSLATQGRLRVLDGDADAIAHTEIKLYGFLVSGAFTNKMRIKVISHIKVIRKDGTLLYEGEEGDLSSEATYHSMSEFLETPTLIAAAFHDAAANDAARQVQVMTGVPAPKKTDPPEAPETDDDSADKN